YTQEKKKCDIIFIDLKEFYEVKNKNIYIKNHDFIKIFEQNFSDQKTVKRFFIIINSATSSHWSLIDVCLQNKSLIFIDAVSDSTVKNFIPIFENDNIKKLKKYYVGFHEDKRKIQNDFFSCHVFAAAFIKHLFKIDHRTIIQNTNPKLSSDGLSYDISWNDMPYQFKKYTQSINHIENDIKMVSQDTSKWNEDITQVKGSMRKDYYNYQKDEADEIKQKNIKIFKKNFKFIFLISRLITENNLDTNAIKKIIQYYKESIFLPDRTAEMTIDKLNKIVGVR
ncbi:MAG: hypothetical protein K2X39_02080, partial [Silvanigrellaceae bacterium]|nr:hypothetical protein [Silvanigrellaceae bacterium]